MSIFETERLYARKFDQNDLTDLVEIMNSENNRQYLTKMDRKQCQKFIEWNEQNPTDLYFAIIEKKSNLLIGMIGIKDDKNQSHHKWETIVLKENYQNKGYGTEINRAFFNYIRNHTNVKKIFFGIYTHNQNSLKMQKKLRTVFIRKKNENTDIYVKYLHRLNVQIYTYLYIDYQKIKKIPFYNYDKLMKYLFDDIRFEEVYSPDLAQINPFAKSHSKTLMMYVSGIEIFTIKSELAKISEFKPIIPETFLVNNFNIIDNKSKLNGIWILKPSWVEIGGNWGIKVFFNSEEILKFLGQCQKSKRIDIIRQIEKNTNSGNIYQKYQLPEILRKNVKRQIDNEIYYYSVLQKFITSDKIINIYDQPFSFTLRVLLLCWFGNQKIQIIRPLDMCFVRLPKQSLETDINQNQLITDSFTQRDDIKMPLIMNIRDEWLGTQSKSIVEPINLICQTLQNQLRPNNVGYAYFGIDFIRDENGKWYLLEINEHPEIPNAMTQYFYLDLISNFIKPAINFLRNQ